MPKEEQSQRRATVVVITNSQPRATKSTSAELDANTKPEQNWMPANIGPDNGRLQNKLSIAGRA